MSLEKRISSFFKPSPIFLQAMHNFQEVVMRIVAKSVSFDKVIKSKFINAEADYEFAIRHLVPRTGEFSAQRVMQNQKFYDRLAKDIVNGCIMPPLTLAIIAEPESCGDSISECQDYIHSNIDKLFILDGI